MTDTLYEKIVHHATESPSKVALIGAGESLTFADLISRVDRFRGVLPPEGRQRIALCIKSGLEVIPLFIAATSLGHNVLIFSTDWPSALFNAIVDKQKPDLIIADNMVCEGTVPVDQLRPTPQSIKVCDVEHNTQVDFYTGFTSGSTGGPKGFVRSQQSWLNSFAADQELFGFAADDVFIVPGNLSHSLGFYAALRGLYGGATTVLFAHFHPGQILDAVERHNGSVIYATPVQIRVLMDAQRDKARNTSSMRLVLSSGAKFPVRWCRDLPGTFPKASFHEFYGTSELSYITSCPITEQSPPSLVGKPFAGVDIQILGPDRHQLPAGEVGDIYIKSKFVFSGYATENAQTSLEGCAMHEGALSVGDTGFMDGQGQLHITGRSDRMFQCSGRNIYPEEIEMVIQGFPGISQAAVFGEDDPKRGLRVVALMLETEVKHISDVLAHCRRALPAWSIPRIFYKVQAWPFTASGKTDLMVLKALLQDQVLERVR